MSGTIMDTADQAQEAYECLDSRLIQYAISKRKKAVPFTGFCHYCFDQVHSPKAYCDKDCEADWEKEQRLLKIMGIAQ
jgi:hypothetical protein